jgi:hypothetical protein
MNKNASQILENKLDDYNNKTINKTKYIIDGSMVWTILPWRHLLLLLETVVFEHRYMVGSFPVVVESYFQSKKQSFPNDEH